jgi:hypothetical protein
VKDAVPALHSVTEDDERIDPSSEVMRFAALPPERRRLLLHMDGLMSSIPFGTVVVVLQDGHVIQIETSEKIRLR